MAGTAFGRKPVGVRAVGRKSCECRPQFFREGTDPE